MANLRRHFNFNGKQSLSQESFSLSKSTFSNFDKITLMNDICNCLDLCCSYIQALNSLCSAGSSLARSLFYTVREAPAYQNISLQFLSVWEEVSKATAGASAAVKTETLMLLQEVLNSLEICPNDANIDDIILNSFQAVGSCICSFIELQAQFSWSTWKSLSKLSKNCTNDPLKASLSLQWKSFDKNPSKIYANTDLNSTIKKHYSQLFCKIGVPKLNESLSSAEKQFHSATSSSKANVPNFQFTSEKIQHNVSADSLWSSTIWATKNLESSPQTDLDEVINLLSCVPVQQYAEKIRNKNLLSYPLTVEQLDNTINEGSQSSAPAQLKSSKTWPKTSSDYHQNDSLYWHVNDSSICMNSANRPHMYENTEFFKHWEYGDLKMWNASSTETNSSSDDVSSHCLDSDIFSADKTELFKNLMSNSCKRGSQSGESMPDGLENISEYGESTMGLQSKINTWPLKQTSSQEFYEI